MLTQTIGEVIERQNEEKARKQQEVIKSQDEKALEDGKKFLAEHKVGYIVMSSANPKLIKLVAPGIEMKPFVAGYQIWVATEKEWLALDMEKVGYTVIAKVDKDMKVLEDYYKSPEYF